MSPHLSRHAPPALQGVTSVVGNLEKSLSEFRVREGEKVKVEKRGENSQFESCLSMASCGYAQNDDF